MLGTLLVGIGLGLVVVAAFVYWVSAPSFFLELLASEQRAEERVVRLVILTIIVSRAALQLMGVIGGVLVIVGVAQRFGVQSALVVVTVTFVGYLLRHIIAVAKESVSSLHPSTGELRSARPH